MPFFAYLQPTLPNKLQICGSSVETENTLLCWRKEAPSVHSLLHQSLAGAQVIFFLLGGGGQAI